MQVILETPQRSTRKIMGDITNNPSRASIHRMLLFDLKLIPYTISVMQHLKESDIAGRRGFARWMKEHIEILVLWFSDKAHFYLNTQVNRKNYRYWGSEKPNISLKNPYMARRLQSGPK